ncbi:MAG: hypothetical protein ACKVU0_01090 [Saprospiraceae bacterium]
MNLENFEKTAQTEFENYRPEGDNEQIWQNIEPHLRNKKKRRLFILFFWGLGLGLISLLLWKQYTPENAIQANKLESEHSSNRGIEPISGAQNGSPVDEKSLSELPNAANAGSNAYSNKGIPQNKVSRNQPDERVQKGVAHLDYHGNPQYPNLGVPHLSEQVSAESLSGLPDKEAPKAEVNQAKAVSPKSVGATAPSIAPNPAGNAVITGNADLAKKTDLAENATLAKPAEAPNEIETPKEKSASKSKKSQRIKPHKRKRAKQTLTLGSGLALPISVLQPNPQVEANEALLTNRKASEKSLEALTGSFLYTYATPKGLLFRGGLDYQRLNERFEVSYNGKETKIVTGVLTQTVDGTGQIISQTMGDKEVTTTRVYTNISFNNYQFLNLPFGVGFQRVNKKSQWELLGGLDINLWFRFTGIHFNRFGEPMAARDDIYDDIYKRNTGLGIWASYGYSRNISRNIRWQVSAKAGMPFQRITSERYPLVQKIYTVGLQGGLVFNLVKEPKNKHKKRAKPEMKK